MNFLMVNEFLGSEPAETGASMDILNATILSSNFWPPIQVPRKTFRWSVAVIEMHFQFF
jgi:hypothetical protein